MRVTAAVADRPHGPFHPAELDRGEPGPGEPLVRIAATGICHTDAITRHGDLPMSFPAVLGHEGAGEVVAVGAGEVVTVGDAVTAVRPGDHVVIGRPSCGRCRNCRDGEPRYCARLGEALRGGGRLLGTCVLIGVDHLSTWGKGVIGGSETLIGTLIELHRQGRFPFDRLVRFYELGEIDKAREDSHRGSVLEPVVRS